VPKVVFTANLRRHIQAPASEVAGATVREALDAVFAENPQLRGYVLDDRGELRKHVVVFIDGEMVQDRSGLNDTVGSNSELYVMQALSGG
jgi:molybdopterin converting factor small subunit